MLVSGKPNLRKAIEVLLYVAQRAPNLYNALKCIYFADKLHLARYGSFIYGDEYVAMNYGAVPSAAFDLLKQVRGDGRTCLPIDPSEALGMDGYLIRPRRDADLRMLSASERECLDQAIAKYGDLTFADLRRVSHADPAYQEADENAFISVEAIVRSIGDEDLFELLEDGEESA
ncbi:MAG: Panacea domain-containing protein [Armatimonadota bacterium]